MLLSTGGVEARKALEFSDGTLPRALVHDVSAGGVPHRRTQVPELSQIHLQTQATVQPPMPVMTIA